MCVETLNQSDFRSAPTPPIKRSKLEQNDVCEVRFAEETEKLIESYANLSIKNSSDKENNLRDAYPPKGRSVQK